MFPTKFTPGKVAKTAIVGGDTKASRTTAAHGRGFVGGKKGLTSAPTITKTGKKAPVSYTSGQSDTKRVTGSSAGIPKPKATGKFAGQTGNDDYETEPTQNKSYDGDCACGDPACTGCIVGAMQSDRAKKAFVSKASNAYGKR